MVYFFLFFLTKTFIKQERFNKNMNKKQFQKIIGKNNFIQEFKSKKNKIYAIIQFINRDIIKEMKKEKFNVFLINSSFIDFIDVIFIN